MALTLPERFQEAARRYGPRVAVQIRQGDSYTRYTYEQLLRATQAITTLLQKEGIGRGDRVVLLSENRPEWGIAYLGILSAGATAVPLDAQLTAREIGNILRHADPKAICASRSLLPTVIPLARESSPAPLLISLDEPSAEAPTGMAEILRSPGGSPPPLPTSLGSGDAPASILYTSGTTGTPKGVVLTHRNFLSNVESILSIGLCSAEDNLLAILPLHHTYPFMATFLVPLFVGATATYLTSLKAPDLLRCLQETGVTVIVGVPQLYTMLHTGLFTEIGKSPRSIRLLASLLLALNGGLLRLTRLNAGKIFFGKIHRRFGGKIRILASGGAKLDPGVAWDFTRLGFTVIEGYGLTETSPVVTFNPLRRPKIGSVGTPLPGVTVTILNPDGEGVGEIAIRGPNVMAGYYKNPEATAEVMQEGWFLSGDLGYRDREGYLFITGRAKEVIVLSSGKNIYPEEVEKHYLKSLYIKEICVLGVEGGRGGGTTESLQALVVPDFDYFKSRRMANFEEMIRWDMENLAKELPTYKRVTGIKIVKDPLPRTRLGKIQRYLVQQTYATEAPTTPRADAALAEEDQKLLASPLASKILAHLATLSPKKEPIRLDDNLELDLGLDSLGRVELLVALEEICQTALPDELGSEVFTVRDLLTALSGYLSGETTLGTTRTGRPSWGTILKRDLPPDLAEAVQFPTGVGARLFYLLLNRSLSLLFVPLCRLSSAGTENIPERGPYILAPNHCSYLDAFVATCAVPLRLTPSLHFLGFQEFFSHPITSRLARVTRVIPIDMDSYLVKALQMAAAVLRRGGAVCIFPEGARSIDGEVKRFKKGAAILATELGVPLLPVYIRGTYECWPRGQTLPRPARVTVTFGAPVTISELLRKSPPGITDPYEAAATALRERVIALGATR